MNYSMSARFAAAILAVVAWTGEALFLLANARAFGSFARSISWSLSFLTDWSGILVAIVCTALALRVRKLSTPAWVGLATTAIVLVGVMFGSMGGWVRLGRHSFSNLLSFSSLLGHVVLPVALLLVWLTVLPHGGLRWKDAGPFMLFPLAYLVQMFVRGVLGGGYPYPMVDVPHVGWFSALLFCAGVTILFLLVGLLLIGADNLLTRRAGATREIGRL